MAEDNTQQEKTVTSAQSEELREQFAIMRQNWLEIVTNLNRQMERNETLEQLLNVVYTRRQEAVETYYTTYSIINKRASLYRTQYAAMYNRMKMGQNGIRYSTESAIQSQCESALSEEKSVIDELKNFADYMWETVRSIDNLIYAIPNKIKLIEIKNGLKF